MPIYEYNGKRYNIPEAKAQELTARMPGAKLINEAPYYLADNPSPQPPSRAQINVDVPEVNQTTFDGEIARQTAGKQLGGGVSVGQKQNIADITGDMYGNRELTLPDHKNAAQKQEGFWATGLGDALEKLGAGAGRTFAGLAQVSRQSPYTMTPQELGGKTPEQAAQENKSREDYALQAFFDAADKLSERGARHGDIRDPETGEVRRKTYSDLLKEGKPFAAAGEILLTATESAPTSAMAFIPVVGMPLIMVSAAGQEYYALNNNPETKDMPEWKKILNASTKGAIEGITEKLGAKVDTKVFEPILKKMTEQTVKGILKRGGIGALIQTIMEGVEEFFAQLGGNTVDYVTGVSDEYKPFEGSLDAAVYGMGGGAQFAGVTGAGTIYRAVEQHKANVETAKVQNTLRLWESISKKQSQALPALNNEKQNLEAELGDLTTLTFEEVANSPEATPELVEARRRYDIVNAEYEGVMENLKREVDDFIAPQVQAIQDVATTDGMITELNVGTEEAPDIVYLAGGNIAINEDGTIDPAGTAPLLTVKNSEGKKRLISRKRIVTAQQDDLDATIEGIKQRAYEKFVRPLADKLEGKTHFQNGEQVEYVNAKGETVAGTVTAKQNNTVTVVGIDGKKTETFTEDELAQRLIGETIDDIRTRDVIQVELNGQVYDADVTNIQDGIAELHIPSFPEADGRFQDVTAAELRRMRVMPQVEGQEQVQEGIKKTDETPENEGSATGQTEQNVSGTEETGAESHITPEQQQEQFIASLPKTKEGDVDYTQIEDDDTFITALKSEFPEDAAEIVEEYRKQAQKRLSDADRVQDPVKKKRAQRAAQAQVDRFSNMYERLNPKAQYQARVAGLEEGTIREREAKMGEYLSLRDYLLRNIATGKHKFRWNKNDTDKGLGGELFATKNQETERKKRISFLNNNGYSPESLAEYIAENAGQGSEINPGWFTDASQIRDEIIDILLSHDTPTAMIDAATELRKQPQSIEEYAETFVDPTVIYEYEANEASQDEMLRYLPRSERNINISEVEIDTYFTEQIDEEEYNNYINNINFEQNNKQDGTDQNRRTGTGSDRTDAGQVTGTEKAADDTGRDTGRIGSNQDEGSDNLTSTGEATISGKRSSQDSIEQPTAEGAKQEPGRPAEGPSEWVDEQIEPEAAKVDVNPTEAQKQQQFDIIQASNPMLDDVHTGIRSADEILTAEEAFSYNISNVEDATPDFTSADMTEALRTGKVTVYSSYPIENGVFVSPSKMEAQNYAGEGKVYSKNVPVTNVAWIDQTQGQYADVTEQKQEPGRLAKGSAEGVKQIAPSGNVAQNENINNFVTNDQQDEKPGETRLDNRPAVEGGTIGRVVGGQPQTVGINRTIQASNSAGSVRADYTAEELEELESRGLNPYWDKPTFHRILKAEAQKNGVWLDKSYLSGKTLLHDQKTSGTSENDMYLNPDGKAVTKLNNLSYVKGSDHHNNLNSFIDRINAHNALFPELAYTIIGFMENKNGFPAMVLEQPFISDVEGNATQEEINDYLTSRGFKLDGTRQWSNEHQVWTNGVHELFDARPANVLKGNDGQFYFIDTFPHSVEYMTQPGVDGSTSTNPPLNSPNQTTSVENNHEEFSKENNEQPVNQTNDEQDVGELFDQKENIDKQKVDETNKGIAQKAIDSVENDRKNKPQAQGKSTSTPVEKIEDFGEKIGGARKDLAQEYRTKLSEIKEDDIRSKPLSKIFPRLDLKKLVENEDLTQDDALYLNYRYDKIPTKPRVTGGFSQKRKLDKWINDVQKEIKIAHTILSQEKSFGHLDLLKKTKLEENAGYRYFQNGDEIEVTPEQRLMLNDGWMHIKTLKALGFPTSGVKMGNATLQYRVHSGEQYIVKVNNKRSIHKTFEDAVDYLRNELEKPTNRETVFNIYQNRKSGKYFIGKPIQGKEPIQLSEWFDTQKEVTDYFRDNRDEVQAKWDAMGLKPEERRSENRERQGRDWRNGKDVTPDQFQSEFGFRGTEFGNWVNQQERQYALNNAYDALMDLSSVLDISPRALSLNGELGMAFGARGTGNAGGSTASAHYESAKVVINLTKKSGAGSLAHEWWHALDNYFARMGNKSLDFATDGTKGLDANVREEMKQAFNDIVDAIKKSGLPKRSGELDKTRSKPYWATNVEMSARAFENYVIEALSEKGESNDYLVNFKDLSDWATAGSFESDSYPYPTKEESHDINEKFQQFFDTIQEKVNEETGNTILFRKVDEAGYYSTVEDALESIKQEKGTPEQFKAMLLKNGAKQAELDWMGWDERFPDGKQTISKTDIQDWIDQNRIEVQEVEKGKSARVKSIPRGEWVNNLIDDSVPEKLNDGGDWVDSNGSLILYNGEESYVDEFIRDLGDYFSSDFISTLKQSENIEITDDTTKYSQYILPGGKNYRELLLTMPTEGPKPTNFHRENGIWIATRNGKEIDRDESISVLRDRTGNDYASLAKDGQFKSGHFDEPNIVAHVRFNEREVNGERVLFIEEIQSDWAQQGKKEGFKQSNVELRPLLTTEGLDITQSEYQYHTQIDGRTYDVGKGVVDSEESAKQYFVDWLNKEIVKSNDRIQTKNRHAIPDMPFKKTDQWVNLALRRMMMYAAENGYDRIAWTAGQQQADRYDLSKQVDWIEYGKNENGTYWFTIPVEYSKPSELTEQELESYVGKDIAKKMIDGEGVDGELGGKRLQGNDLKVGGSGMIAFYDQIVPKAAKKLGKPFGADVEMIDIPEIGQQQSIPVTDALREIAPNGMPLFRKRDTEAREAYAMREWNRAKKAIDELAAKMGVSVEIIETTEGLPKAKAEAKGWYDTKSKKIAIVMPNHTSSWDAQATLLHEAVGHHGLRELFGEHFDTFLDNVYNNAEEGIKDQIDRIGGDTRRATDEYLSRLAEDQEILQTDRLRGFFNEVRKFFFEMLAKLGFNPGFKLSENELKYILWRSYQNLSEPGRYRSIAGHAKDVAMQHSLKVGNYAEKEVSANVAEEPGAPPTRKLNKELFGRLSDAFNNAKTLDDKYDAAFEIIQGIEAVIGGNQAILSKTHEELANIVPGLSTEESQDIMDGLIDGMHTMGEVFLDIEAIDSAGNLISTWFHENAHRITRNVFSGNELEQFIDSINPDYKHLDMLLPESYRDGEKDMQGSEFIARAVEYVLTENSLEDVANNNIDYGTMPDKLRNFVEQVFNNLHDEQSQKSRINTGETRNRGLSSRISNDNRGTGQGNSKENSGIFENFRTGAYLKQRALENNDGSTEGIEERVNDLFENADNLKKSIPNYPGFLNDVLQGSPAKSDIIANAREKGFTSMPKAIEEYLTNVEDPAELSRIKELLGVDMPDNALRYMLWRNANPDDGTVVWKAKDAVKTNELDENILFRKGEVPSSIKNDKYEQRIRSRHNRGFRSLMYGIEEGWLDRMASLRIIQDAITGGKAIPDRANAYMLENQLSSRNGADIRYFTKNLVDPFLEQIHKIFGIDRNAADEYMNAKHGLLERNDNMAEEEAKRKYAKKIAALNKELSDGKIDEDAYNEKMEAINGKIEAYAEKLKEEKDYSGLTAIAAERGREDFKAVAQEIVAEVEGRVSKEDIDDLWRLVNKATKWVLDKQYNAGIMTKETYEKIRNMYKYYVPLRGFEEVTATDLYEYIDNSPSNFEGTLKTAHGRTSRAESPTATIMGMGESAIMQANRNRMKQAFYRLVATNPSNYASIEDVWFVETADGFEERFPKISPTASAEEVLEAIADFNNEMADLAAEGQAFQGRNKLDVGVKIMKAQASEHVVRVWVAGEEKVIFINGNPRAAQAINGLLQKKPAEEKSIRHGVEYWSRQMSANFTSRNPAFMVTNLMRDVQFAVISAAVKEGMPYSMQLAKNITLVGKTISANVFKDGVKDNAEFQKYWEEFEANGGETGYANLHSIDFNRKYVNKKLREFSDQRDFLKPFRAWVRFMENGNRTIEDMSRFATYVTSRQIGRSIERSVSDAKEITINFNRKGSGGFGANLIHSFYLFSNPALQSMRLMGMLAKNHPVRFTAMLSTAMGAGFMVPMINELLLGLFGDDDDKEKYRNITPWVRRNNLVLYVPGTKDKFVTLMLPHELRAFYGIGEMAYEKANGGLRRENMAVETAKQMTAMLPIDPMGGPDWWVPDALKPPYQAYVTNRNFMGSPIYRDTPWNKLDPEWTKAYKGTPELLVEAAKGASDTTGGDDVVPGWANANPARAYHIFSGYLGGFMTTYTDMSMIAFNLLTGRDVRANDVPVVNKLIRTSDEKTEELRINSEYFYYIDWIGEYEHRTKGYEKRVQDPEYRDKYMDVMRDKEQRMYNFAKGQIALIDQLKDYDEEKANEMKEQFVRKMWEYEDQD